MQFRKVGDTWKPIDTDERLKDALMTAGSGFLLFSIPVAILAGIAVAGFAFFDVGNPFFAMLALAVQHWDLVVLFPAIGVVAGLQFGWHRSGCKSFEEVAIETLEAINERLERLEERLD
jgi:hypothetical protein